MALIDTQRGEFRMRVLVGLLAIGCLLMGQAHAQQPSQSDVEQRLSAALALPSPQARREAALALAADKDTSLEQWQGAIPAVLSRQPAEPGIHNETLELWVGDEVLEQTQVEVFVPSNYDPGVAAPLLVVLHGTGGTGRGLTRTWQGVAESLGMLVMAPSEAGSNGGYAFTERERQSTLSALRWARLKFRIDVDRIHLTGVSRGGHMTWDLGLRNPDRFASLVPMVGSPRLELTEGRNNLRYIENVAHIAIRDLQGEGDDPLMLVNLHLAFERLDSFGARDAQLLTFPDLGHSVDMNAVEWRSFFGEAKRDPAPDRIVLCAARAGEGRNSWLEVLELDKDIEEVFQPRITAKLYNSLSPAKRQALVAKRVDAKTARIEIERTAPGRFKAKLHGIRAFKLLLTESMLDQNGKVVIRAGSRTTRGKPSPSSVVFLSEFVERMDPGFLPVAEIVVRRR